jgi:hypothetical protein
MAIELISDFLLVLMILSLLAILLCFGKGGHTIAVCFVGCKPL